MAALIRAQPENVDALIMFANAKARLVNSTWAIFMLADAVRDEDDFVRTRNALRPLAPEQDDKEAEDAFREALRLSPKLMEARLALIDFLWAVGRPDESEEMLRQAADEMPGHAAVNHALGSYYLSRHREADAARYLKAAGASAVYGSAARFALADYYLAKDRDAEALTILNAMTPEDDAAGAVSVRIAPIEFRLGKRDEAMRRVDGLLARQAAHAALPKAQFLLAMGMPDKALPFARTAAGEDPWSADARSAYGQALSATGDLEGARKEYVDATKFRPTAARLFLELSDVLTALKLGDQALLFARDAAGRLPGDLGAEIAVVKAQQLIKKDQLAADQGIQRLRSRYGSSVDALLPLRAVPDTAIYRYHLGSGYKKAGDLKRARVEFTRALQIDPKFMYAEQARAALGSIPP
jgi:Tfp pilus assembly protein PilF